MKAEREPVIVGEVGPERLILEQVEHAGDRAKIADIRIVPRSDPPLRSIAPGHASSREVEVVDVLFLLIEVDLHGLTADFDCIRGIRHSHPYTKQGPGARQDTDLR